MHYYQHHIGDFIKDTSFLTNEEIGIYLKLIWLYYDTEKPLPNNLFELGMKTATRDNQIVLEGLLEMFFVLDEENKCWHHSRCDKEIEHYKQQLTIASKAGKASALKRALNKNSTSVERALNENTTEVQLTNNHKPITNNQIKEKATSVAIVLPDWIPKETWEQFLEMRKRIKKPPTEYAIKLLIDKLNRFRSNGQDIKLVLEKSITSGWQDVFEIKGNPADIVRVTVSSKNEPDPVLLKIKEDAKKAAPIPLEVLAKMAQLRAKQ